MYFDDLLEIIDTLEKFTDGKIVKDMFLDRWGSGSVINMNKALRKLREQKRVCWKKKGVRIFYKCVKQ